MSEIKHNVVDDVLLAGDVAEVDLSQPTLTRRERAKFAKTLETLAIWRLIASLRGETPHRNRRDPIQ